MLKQIIKPNEKEVFDKLKEELETLLHLLDYKNRSYVKKFLRNIITKYFGEDNEL